MPCVEREWKGLKGFQAHRRVPKISTDPYQESLSGSNR